MGSWEKLVREADASRFALCVCRVPRLCLGGPGGGGVCGACGPGVHSRGNKILFPFGLVPGLFVSRALSSLGLSGLGWWIWREHGVVWGVFVVFADFFPLPVTP